MSKLKSKKPETLSKKSTPPKLTFRVIENTRMQGRTPSKDRFTLSKNSLMFNVQTRQHLNIPTPAFVEFCAANEAGFERIVFMRFRKTRRNARCMKVGKANGNYYKIGVPTHAAKEVGMVFKSEGAKGKRKRSSVHYKGEPYRMTDKKRMIMLTPIESTKG